MHVTGDLRTFGGLVYCCWNQSFSCLLFVICDMLLDFFQKYIICGTDVTLINATQTCVCACVHVQELLLFIILLKKRKPCMYIFCYRKMRICVPLQMSCFVKVEVIHIIYYDKLGRSRTLLFVG